MELSTGALAALIAIVIVGTLGAYMLYLQGVADAGPVRASLLCSVEPVSAMIISALWLGTEVSIWDAAGCFCILIMIFLVTEREQPGKATSSIEGPQVETAFDDPPLFAGRASVLGYYTSRPAERRDFQRARALLDFGHETFAALGIDEGRKKYPSARRLMHSIGNSTTHVVEDARGHMIAVFAVSFSPEKNYAGAIDGAWLTDGLSQPQSYAELHWVSVAPEAKRRGVGMFILETADHIARAGNRISVRADVYEQNIPIQKLLEKHGYIRCGSISIGDVFGRKKMRIVYERLL